MTIRCARGGLVEQFIDDLAVRSVGRRDGHRGNPLIIGINPQVALVPVEGPRPRLVPMAGLCTVGLAMWAPVVRPEAALAAPA